MRLVALLALILILAACRGTQPYTQQDLQQVRQANAELRPTFLAFEQAYTVGNTARILLYFRREQKECKLVDEIDKRDTIDPNVNLFLASVTLDDMCNGIESAYAGWAQAHGYPYDKSIVPSRPSDAFTGSAIELNKAANYLRHPAALS